MTLTFQIFAEIDFSHPLFAPFADPRFSDFTKIHFWKYRRLEASALPDAHVVAKFDYRPDSPRWSLDRKPSCGWHSKSQPHLCIASHRRYHFKQLSCALRLGLQWLQRLQPWRVLDLRGMLCDAA